MINFNFHVLSRFYYHEIPFFDIFGKSFFNFVEYHELEGGIISSSSGGEGLSRSGSPTPRNSPRPAVKQISSSVQQGGDSSDGGGSRAQGQTLTRSQIAQAVTSLQRQSVIQT